LVQKKKKSTHQKQKATKDDFNPNFEKKCIGRGIDPNTIQQQSE